jgi:hypothetical protein
MLRGPKAAAVGLTGGERTGSERLRRRRGVGRALAQRIRIVLAGAEPSATDLGVAKTLGVGRQRRWRPGAGAPPRTGWKASRMRHAPGRRGRATGDEAVERLPGRADAGGSTAARHALEHARDGAPRRHEPDRPR